MTPQERAEAYQAAMQRFDQGERLATIDPHEFKRMWLSWKKLAEIMPSSSATGLGAIAGGACVDHESKSSEEIVALTLRPILLAALIKRGVLDAYIENGEPRDEVFRAAATIPLAKDDFAVAIVLAHVADADPQAAAHFKKEAREHGYDPEHPTIDAKFLECMKQIENQSKMTDNGRST
jgi:hypothetical protein